MVRSMVAAGLVLLSPGVMVGQIRFEARPAPFTAPGTGASGSAWADFDGDGRVDVAIASRDSLPTRVYRGVAGGWAEVLFSSPVADANAAAWADLDGDGRMELVLASQEGVAIYAARPDGMTAVTGAFLSAAYPRNSFDAVAIGDLDGDGDYDITAGAHGGAGVFVLLNDGAGRFTTATRDDFPFASFMGGAQIADLDDDGRVDLLFSGAPFPGFRTGSFVYWQEADGWTADRAAPFAVQPGGLGSSIGDIDGDGDLDVFLAGWRRDTPSFLYLNEGRRQFRSAMQFPERVVGSAFFDADNDGQLDLVLSTGYSDTGHVAIYRGVGAGRFERIEVPGVTDVPGRYSGLTVVDFDRDGRLDLHVNALADRPLLLRNTSPARDWVQLEVRGTAPHAIRFRLSSGRTVRVPVPQHTGFGGHGERIAQLGLADGESVQSAELSWPGREPVRVTRVPVNQRTVVDAGGRPSARPGPGPRSIP